MNIASIDDIRGRVGQEIGVSPWIEISQQKIDRFAEVTGDHQFIHVDRERAAQTPFGGTIAHGFFTLSLLSQMAGAMPRIEGVKLTINCGLDRVRFISPVKAGKRVRGRFILGSMEEKAPGHWQSIYNVTVEIEGEEKPALAADWIGRVVV